MVDKIKRQQTLKKDSHEEHFKVTIFGSARIKKASPIYKQVSELAGLLAQENIDIITGGGPGLMDAANQGHYLGRKNNQVHSIGLSINLPHEQKTGSHLDLQKEFDKFSTRLDDFMRLSNVVIIASGGIGTLLELFYTWQLMQVKHICNIPIILLGEMWAGLLDWIKEEPLQKGLLKKSDLKLIYYTKNNLEALTIIKKAYQSYQQGQKNFCLNYKKYK